MGKGCRALLLAAFGTVLSSGCRIGVDVYWCTIIETLKSQRRI